ncbi:MAG TPA: TolC family protein [bacterium]|nr:TolC family protein [bacterium]
MKPLCFLVTMILAVSTTAGPPAEPIDLFEAIRTALSENPHLHEAQARIDQAEAYLLEAQSRFQPTASLNGEALVADAPSSYLFKRIDQRRLRPNTDFNDPGRINNSELGVEITHNLYNGGRDSRNLQIGEINVDIAEDRELSVENQLIHSVIESYYDVLAAQELIRTAQQSVETVEPDLRDTRIRFDGGSALWSDVLSLEVRLAQAREELIRSENQRDLFLVVLANLMGLEEWQGLALSGEEWRPRPIPETVEEAVPAAFESRPELAAARKMIERGQMEIKQSKSEYYPRVDTFARLYVDDNQFGYRADDANWVAGVALCWELYSGAKRKAHRRLAEAVLKEMEAVDRQAALQVRLDVNRAYLNLKAANARQEVAQTSVKQADESLRLVQRQYEGGSATVTRYLDAEQDLTMARSREITARYDLKKAHADVGRSLGWCSLCARDALGGSDK